MQLNKKRRFLWTIVKPDEGNGAPLLVNVALGNPVFVERTNDDKVVLGPWKAVRNFAIVLGQRDFNVG